MFINIKIYKKSWIVGGNYLILCQQINDTMSTNSLIGKLLPDGTIKSIYCHWDGQPSYNGKILKEYYTDEKKIDTLLELGSLEVLDKEIGNKLGKFTARDGQCIFYGRDREKDNTGPKICSDIETWMKTKPGIEWQYLWDGKEWKTYKTEYQY